MHKAWGRAAGLALVTWLAACGAGGTGGAAGCGGGSTLQGGFPHDERIDNAGTLRLTRSGLDFLAENVASVAGSALGTQQNASGVATFEVPTSKQVGHAPVGPGVVPIDYTIDICPNGPKPNPPECTAEIDLKNAKLRIDAVTPNALRIAGDIPLRLQNLPLTVGAAGASFPAGVGFGTQGTCTGAKPSVGYKTLPIEISLPFVAETNAPRDGLTKVDVDNAVINVSIAKDDITVCGDCGLILNALGVCSFLVNQAKESAFASLGGDKLGEQLKSALKSSVCEKPNPANNPPCPAGTSESGGVCVFTSNPGVCATTMLGTESHLDTSGLASGLSAGEGGLDFLLAAAGALNPAPGAAADDTPYVGHTPNGATFALLGGTKASPPSKCVPAFTPTLPTNIPVPDELLANTLQPWPEQTPGPHVGIALAGRFLDYAFGSVYGSGALCLGTTTEQADQLKTGLLSILIPSIKNLTFEQKGAAMAITTRPQVPPRVTLGSGADVKTDPLLRIQLDKFAIDFYVFTMDRFVRVFTFTADLTIPVNLQTGKDPQKNPKGGILPVLGDLTVANASVEGSALLLEDPSKIASALATIVGGLTSQLTGALTPVDLASAVAGSGIGLTIPEGGIRRITKGDDNFLAIFGNLEVAQAATLEADARAEIVERIVNKDAMTLTTLRPETRPVLRTRFASSLDDTGKGVEWSWAIDRGARSAWSADRAPSIQTDDLVMQGRHVLRVWARASGESRTEDSTPAEVPFVIDALAPEVRVREPRAGTVAVDAFDYVSDAPALRGRVRRFVGERETAFGDWTTLDQLTNVPVQDATAVEVEVRDEDGNVGRTKVALIRGRTDPTLAGAATSGGCGCDVPGTYTSTSSTALTTFAVGLALALAIARRRRSTDVGRVRARSSSKSAVLGLAGISCALATIPACSCGSEEEAPALCGADCRQPCGPALPYGMIGAYTSIAKTKSGAVLVAGYADVSISPDGTALYGDLVVGPWDAAKNTVAWEAVDGVPKRTDGTCPANDRMGFRGGEGDPGDDVGLYTSLLIGEGDVPLVAYHDATHRSLKFAYKSGGAWKSYAVLEKKGLDAGRYAKLVMLENRPAIVFLAMEPASGGKVRSRIVLARAKDAVPADVSKWTFTDLHSDDASPCRPDLCAKEEACAKDTRACEKTIAGCPGTCAAGTACLSKNGQATCSPVSSEPAVLTIPEVVGAGIEAAVGPKGLGVVAYDRIRGNLLSITPNGIGWAVTMLDGETGSRNDGTAKDTGDVGLGPALAIADNNDFHIAAVDGTREALVYYVVQDGTKVAARNVVDDGFGLGVGAPPFSNGKHIIGEDAVVRLEPETGGVTICYQDATAIELRCASGARASDGATTFTVRALETPGKQGGFFPQLVPGSRDVLHHYRALDKAAFTYSGDITLSSF